MAESEVAEMKPWIARVYRVVNIGLFVLFGSGTGRLRAMIADILIERISGIRLRKQSILNRWMRYTLIKCSDFWSLILSLNWVFLFSVCKTNQGKGSEL